MLKKRVDYWSKLFGLDYLMQSLYFKNIIYPLPPPPRRLNDDPLEM